MLVHRGGWSGRSMEASPLNVTRGGCATEGPEAREDEAVASWDDPLETRVGRLACRSGTRLDGSDWLNVWHASEYGGASRVSVLEADAELGVFAHDFGGEGDCLARCLAAAKTGVGSSESARALLSELGLAGRGYECEHAPQPQGQAGASLLNAFTKTYTAIVHVFEDGALATSWYGAPQSDGWCVRVLVMAGHWRLLMHARARPPARRPRGVPEHAACSTGPVRVDVVRTTAARDARTACDPATGVRKQWLSRRATHGRGGPRAPFREVRYEGPGGLSRALGAADAPEGADVTSWRPAREWTPTSYARARRCVVWVYDEVGDLEGYRHEAAAGWWSVCVQAHADGSGSLRLYGGFSEDEREDWASAARSGTHARQTEAPYVTCVTSTEQPHRISAIGDPDMAGSPQTCPTRVSMRVTEPLVRWDRRDRRAGRPGQSRLRSVLTRIHASGAADGYCWKHVWLLGWPPALLGRRGNATRSSRRVHLQRPGGRGATAEACLALAATGEATDLQPAGRPARPSGPSAGPGAEPVTGRGLQLDGVAAFCRRMGAVVHVYRGETLCCRVGLALTTPGRGTSIVWTPDGWGLLIDELALAREPYEAVEAVEAVKAERPFYGDAGRAFAPHAVRETAQTARLADVIGPLRMGRLIAGAPDRTSGKREKGSRGKGATKPGKQPGGDPGRTRKGRRVTAAALARATAGPPTLAELNARDVEAWATDERLAGRTDWEIVADISLPLREVRYGIAEVVRMARAGTMPQRLIGHLGRYLGTRLCTCGEVWGARSNPGRRRV